MNTLILGILIYVLFALIFAIVLITTREIWNKHKKATKGIENYNSTMTAFAYKTPMNKQEIISAISMRNIKDDMEYEFNPDDFTIKFSRYGETSIEYQITILETEKFSIVKVAQISTMLLGNQRIFLSQNSFWTQKLKAESIPYHTYFK